MGGKVWSDSEEETFWTVLARQAPPGFHKESKAKKKSHHELAKSWEPLIDVMKFEMLEKNPTWTEDDLPRSYSAISIYEHWFQNLVQGKHSPNAGRHVRAHQEWLKNTDEDEPEPGQSLSWITIAAHCDLWLSRAQPPQPLMPFETFQEWYSRFYGAPIAQQWPALPATPSDDE
ncbi:hypothetical protein KVR01_011279 [Diaporthe batatas]|uniref:uncharacterized protein n=1 Tax=Diaporthe batatas TaxID=748121 RepID=UPI001D03BB5E|nr:uncharacterized protein KVR01_011279 [Diaporthe batatas]KAG8158836.1 hypothetical protein KVR01_011279 [Diaporthe batatas]